ncbi:MAG TPA: lactate utilization protein C [Burkholderiaceae bacterium]
MNSSEQAKAAILARIRAGKRGGAADSASPHAYLAAPQPGPRPALGPDLRAHFVEQALRMACTVEQVAAMDDAPAAAVRYLDALSLGREAVAWASLLPAAPAWLAAGLALAIRQPQATDTVGITGAFCGIAETGTVMLLPGGQDHASTALLPATHIAIVPASRIVASMEDAFALALRERGELPRTVNCISGPSRTGDIEQTIVLGAHGPSRVHLILVEHA